MTGRLKINDCMRLKVKYDVNSLELCMQFIWSDGIRAKNDKKRLVYRKNSLYVCSTMISWKITKVLVSLYFCVHLRMARSRSIKHRTGINSIVDNCPVSFSEWQSIDLSLLIVISEEPIYFFLKWIRQILLKGVIFTPST